MAVEDTFTFQFEPEMRHVTFAFEDWIKEVKDWRPAWTDVRKLFQNHERQHLDSEGTTTGPKFPELMGKTYPKWKGRHYPGLPILQRDRVLYNALVEEVRVLSLSAASEAWRSASKRRPLAVLGSTLGVTKARTAWESDRLTLG